MEHHYQLIVLLLFIGSLLIFGGSLVDQVLVQLGVLLVLASGLALLLGGISRRRSAGR